MCSSSYRNIYDAYILILFSLVLDPIILPHIVSHVLHSLSSRLILSEKISNIGLFDHHGDISHIESHQSRLNIDVIWKHIHIFVHRERINFNRNIVMTEHTGNPLELLWSLVYPALQIAQNLMLLTRNLNFSRRKKDRKTRQHFAMWEKNSEKNIFKRPVCLFKVINWTVFPVLVNSLYDRHSILTERTALIPFAK